MALSLNQILNRFRSLALSHKQLASFYFGELPNFDAGEDIQYAICCCELLPGSIDRAAKQQRFNFRFFFLDLVHVSERTKENETEVISDMSQVASDFLSMLFNPVYQDDWLINDSGIIAPVTESLGDMVAGCIMETSVIVDYTADSCIVPADDVEFDQTFDMPRTKILHYDGTGAEGNTIPIAALSGKPILAVWRADGYKRAISTAPTDAGKIQVGTVDLGTGKGILGNGSLTLEVGDALMLNEKLDVLYYDA